MFFFYFQLLYSISLPAGSVRRLHVLHVLFFIFNFCILFPPSWFCAPTTCFTCSFFIFNFCILFPPQLVLCADYMFYMFFFYFQLLYSISPPAGSVRRLHVLHVLFLFSTFVFYFPPSWFCAPTTCFTCSFFIFNFCILFPPQ